jgi:hypothetical protein
MDLFPPSSDVEIIDKAEPYVQAELTRNTKGYTWKVKARVKGNDTDELIRIVSQAEQKFQEKYGAQS